MRDIFFMVHKYSHFSGSEVSHKVFLGNLALLDPIILIKECTRQIGVGLASSLSTRAGGALRKRPTPPSDVRHHS